MATVKLQVVEYEDGFKDLQYAGDTPVERGTVVYHLSGPTFRKPTRTSIQVSRDQHIEDKLGRFINHNCDPTVNVVRTYLVAIKTIHPGDSITFDYNANEDEMSNPFMCRCCGRWVAGLKVINV